MKRLPALLVRTASRCRTFAVASNTAGPIIVPPGLRLDALPAAGRSLVAAAPYAAGDVLLEDEPLIAVGPPQSPDVQPYCEHCFRSVAVAPEEQQRHACTGCSAVFCSKECQQSAGSLGHDLVCGPLSSPLESWCAEYGRNFPRVAARLLAKSFSEGQEFENLWGAVNALAAVSVPGDEDALPGEWRTSFALLRDSFRPRMGGGADLFFSAAFNVRTYARLMGTLRLNSFTLQCPLPGAQLPAGSSPAQASARALPHAPSPQLAAAAAAGSSGCVPSSGSAAGGDPQPGGCCGDGSDSTSGGGCGSAGLPPADSASPDRGTALYGAASLVNHSCDPNLDVVVGPRAQLHLRARRTIAEGEHLSIAYVDCALPVAARRAQLQHGYGFACECALCKQQLAEATAAARAAPQASPPDH